MNEQRSHAENAFGQLLIWLVLQLGLLGVGVFQINLYDGDKGNWGLEWMIGGQIVAMSLLFGKWMDRWEKVGWAIAASWPMGILAGLTTGEGVSTIVSGNVYVSIWFLILGLWRWIGKNGFDLYWGMAGGLVALGSGALAYLRAEFTLDFPGGWGDVKHLGPLTEGLWILDEGKIGSGLFLIYALVITGVIALLISLKRRPEPPRAI